MRRSEDAFEHRGRDIEIRPEVADVAAERDDIVDST